MKTPQDVAHLAKAHSECCFISHSIVSRLSPAHQRVQSYCTTPPAHDSIYRETVVKHFFKELLPAPSGTLTEQTPGAYIPLSHHPVVLSRGYGLNQRSGSPPSESLRVPVSDPSVSLSSNILDAPWSTVPK
ncbi:hypothetical protein E4T56_gene10291 [Termitomyces sp. T112]|nr:hypothetical protein E4T56_gene10291 [Termitomyces sp. T112]